MLFTKRILIQLIAHSIQLVKKDAGYQNLKLISKKILFVILRLVLVDANYLILVLISKETLQDDHHQQVVMDAGFQCLMPFSKEILFTIHQ